MNTKKRKNGFTLIEALFAAMLLGLVVAALAAASGAFTMANGYGVDLSTAEFLIEEMRELTANEDFDTLLAGSSIRLKMSAIQICLLLLNSVSRSRSIM
ncbi:MAG: prepilin-type N-terminal cleavage/methylation domain-containing protein [Planctomycetota bacterium]|jgi:hypothetical protein